MKLKRYVFLLQLLFVAVSSSQPSEEQKQHWIQNLASAEFDSVLDAIGNIDEYKIVEAIPALETNLYRHSDISLKKDILQCLVELRSPNATMLIKNFMDSVTYYIILENRKGESFAPHKLSDTLQIRLDCTRYLFRAGDYSTAHFVIEDLQSLKPKTDPWMWVQVFINMPQYASIVKPKVMEYINDSTQGTSRGGQLWLVEEKYGPAFFPDMLELVRHSPDPWIRHIELFALVERGYPNSLDLLKERFLEDSYSTMKDEIADTLLRRYGSVNEYAFLKNNINAIASPINRSFVQESLDKFVPTEPSAFIATKDLLDNLLVLVKTVQSQNWLGNTHFANELIKKLDEAKKHLTKKHADTKDSVNCAKEVRKFQKNVNEVYEDTLEKEKKHEKQEKKFVTVEGWKFLYYNAQYILDRLPAIKKEKGEEEY